MKIGMIWAEDLRGVLGDGERMLWRVPADFAHFKATTMGHPIIMGRRSFVSLPGILPGREHVVLSRNPDFRPAGVTCSPSLEAALEMLAARGEEEVWITGGASVYEQGLRWADELVISVIDLDVSAAMEASARENLVYAPVFRRLAPATEEETSPGLPLSPAVAPEEKNFPGAEAEKGQKTAGSPNEPRQERPTRRNLLSPFALGDAHALEAAPYSFLANEETTYRLDPTRSDREWLDKSGQARWKRIYLTRAQD